MNIFRLFLMVSFLALTAVGQPENVGTTIDKYLSIHSEMGKFSGSVLIARNGKPILRKGYGFADVEKRIPFTVETKQYVASITKMFTAMAIAKLQEKGKIRLEDSICSYIEDCPDAWKQITISHLLHHTSGIPDVEGMEIGAEKYAELLKQADPAGRLIINAKKFPLQFQPGEKFSYSNIGYIILSRIVQKAARKSFPQFVNQTILKPAKMKSSGFPIIDLLLWQKDTRMATSDGKKYLAVQV